MTNSDVIKEFLVGLGFEVNEDDMKRFVGGVAMATAKVVALGAAVTAAAGYITSFVTATASDLDRVSDLAGRVNATAAEILELGHVASLTDSSLEAVMSSFDSLSKAAGDAFLGVGRGRIIFETLGISVKDQNGKLKSTSVIMEEIGQKIKSMERGQQLAVLSRLGLDPTLIGALTTDVSELRAEFESVYKIAGIDANRAAQASSDFMDSLTRLNFVMDAIRKSVALRFMGQIQQGIDSLRKQLVANMPQIISSIEPVIAIALRIAESFVLTGGRVIQVISNLLGWIGQIDKATDGWATIIGVALAAWKFLNLSFLATPLGIVLALVAGLGLLVDDFLTWKEGGDSLIDWTQWEPGMTAAINGIVALKDVVTSSFESMFLMVKMLVQFLTGDFVGGWATAAQAGSAIIDIFKAVWAVISQLLLAFGEFTGLAPVFADGWKKISAVIQVVADAIAAFQKGIGGALPALQNAFGALGSLLPTSVFGVPAMAAGPSMAPSLIPSPQAAATMAGAQQTVSQQTEIIVQGSSSPEATARTVAAAQSRVNADFTRNLKGAAR